MYSKLLFLFILIGVYFSTLNQTKAQSEDTTVYRVADVKPEFPGGPSRMQEYIQFRLNGQQTGIFDIKEGDIILEFIVEKNGRIKKVFIVQGIDPIFDQNFADLFKGMPKWKPATIKGQPVRYLEKYYGSMNYYIPK